MYKTLKLQNCIAIFAMAISTVISEVKTQSSSPPMLSSCGDTSVPGTETWKAYWVCFKQFMEASKAYCQKYGTTDAYGTCRYNTNSADGSNVSHIHIRSKRSGVFTIPPPGGVIPPPGDVAVIPQPGGVLTVRPLQNQNENGIVTIPPVHNVNSIVTIPPVHNVNGIVTIPPVQNVNGIVTIPPVQNVNGIVTIPPVHNVNSIVTIPPVQNVNGIVTIPPVHPTIPSGRVIVPPVYVTRPPVQI